MFCLNMLRISVELRRHDPAYEDMAVKFLDHFLDIAGAMTDMGKEGIGLWNDEDNFFYDVLCMPRREDPAASSFDGRANSSFCGRRLSSRR